MNPEQCETIEETSTRRKLSLADRIKVIDYLRSQVEPIVADSNAAIASIVGTGSGVDISWTQLKYMLEELSELNLSAKVHVKSLLSEEDQRQATYERSIALEAAVAKLESRVAALEKLIAGELAKLESRIAKLEKLPDVERVFVETVDREALYGKFTT
jgi:hypothetical protein